MEALISIIGICRRINGFIRLNCSPVAIAVFKNLNKLVQSETCCLLLIGGSEFIASICHMGTLQIINDCLLGASIEASIVGMQ